MSSTMTQAAIHNNNQPPCSHSYDFQYLFSINILPPVSNFIEFDVPVVCMQTICPLNISSGCKIQYNEFGKRKLQSLRVMTIFCYYHYHHICHYHTIITTTIATADLRLSPASQSVAIYVTALAAVLVGSH